jgi:ferritin
MNKKIQDILNKQIVLEAVSSNFYLAMASWSEIKGFNGMAHFFYQHAEEERMHMLKLVRFINERGGEATIPATKSPQSKFESPLNLFELLLKHEISVTQSINNVVGVCLKENDHVTYNFMQWYITEQIEEEALARAILDRLRMIGNDKGGLYLFNRDMENNLVQANNTNSPNNNA